MRIWALELKLAELEATHDTAPFFEAVRGFYISSTKKMLNKFPFGDTLLKDLSMLQPENLIIPFQQDH